MKVETVPPEDCMQICVDGTPVLGLSGCYGSPWIDSSGELRLLERAFEGECEVVVRERGENEVIK